MGLGQGAGPKVTRVGHWAKNPKRSNRRGLGQTQSLEPSTEQGQRRGLGQGRSLEQSEGGD